jgi:hypothetical protein
MPFLTEDYIAFVDESGDANFQVVTGLFVPARWVRSAYTLLDDIRATEGFRQTDELKAAELATGRGFAWTRAQGLVCPLGMSWKAHALQTGCDIYKRVLGHVARINGLRVLTIGLQTRFPSEAYRLWFWATCAGLTAFPEGDRPRVSMIVIDGQDQGLLRVHRGVVKDFYRSCNRRQTYVSGGRSWFMGGSVLHESHSLPFVQIADLVAHAGFQALANNPDRAYMHQWYEDSLRAVARARHRQIDISATCLTELGTCTMPAAIAAHAAAAVVVP